ncbi:MAG: hypothetical protein VR69_13635 [Peptococcaceae bacterium BRH_c4b]|nr:MAG: hypothetical protein VR69_13635 [Peptococcaceae bacterium BRH_c4b]
MKVVAGDISPKFIDEKLKIEQPVFVVAGIGYPSDRKDELDDHIQHIRGKYKVPEGELKAKSLYRSNPDVFADIVKYFRRNRLPIFIEINDKRYFIACKIVELIFRDVREEGLHPQYIYDLSRGASDFICHEIDDNLLFEFAQVSIKRSPDMLRKWFTRILRFLARHKSKEAELLWAVLKGITESYEAEAQSHKNAHERYLPDPDRNQRGEIIALLPHIPAVVSILQRILKFSNDKGLTDLRIVHDEQSKFESILLDNINSMRDPDIIRNMALFAVNEIAKRRSLTIPDNTILEFDESSDQLGIQIADLLSGTLMRIWSEFTTGNIRKGSRYIPLLSDVLIPYESMHPALGINFVVPQYEFDSFQNILRNIRYKNK